MSSTSVKEQARDTSRHTVAQQGNILNIMDVHPSASLVPPGPTTTEPFAPHALYELKIDTNGDAVADITYRVRVSPSAVGSQTATMTRLARHRSRTVVGRSLTTPPTPSWPSSRMGG